MKDLGLKGIHEITAFHSICYQMSLDITESNIFQVIFHLTLIVHFVYFLVFFCFLKANARPRGQCKVGLRPQILSCLSCSPPNSRITKSWVFCI